MPAARLRLSTPRINTFTGEATPGKIDVSFEQWYHEVQCIKDHYPEAVDWESVIWSLKGTVVDMTRYMRPTTSIAHILKKLSGFLFFYFFLIWWPPSMFSCRTSIRSARGIMRRSPPLPQDWKDPQSDPTPMAQEDDRPEDPTAPQGLPLQFGPQTHL